MCWRTLSATVLNHHQNKLFKGNKWHSKCDPSSKVKVWKSQYMSTCVSGLWVCANGVMNADHVENKIVRLCNLMCETIILFVTDVRWTLSWTQREKALGCPLGTLTTFRGHCFVSSCDTLAGNYSVHTAAAWSTPVHADANAQLYCKCIHHTGCEENRCNAANFKNTKKCALCAI